MDNNDNPRNPKIRKHILDPLTKRISQDQEFLGVSHQTIYRLMKQGLLSHKIGKKRVFLKDELIQWIKNH